MNATIGFLLNVSTTSAAKPRETCDVYEDSMSSKTCKALAYGIVLLLSLIGNSLVIFLVIKHKSLRTTTNFWILNMAVSDLLFPLVAMPFQTAQIFTGQQRWLITGSIGEALCQLTFFLGDISTAISIQSMVFIAVERFCAVKYPLKIQAIRARLKILVPLTWVLAICLHSPYFYIVKLAIHGNKTYCLISWAPAFDNAAATRNYFLIVFVLLYAVPMVLLSLFYSVIIVHLRKKRLTRTQHKSFRQLRKRQNQRVLKMFLTIVLVYFICSTPILVVSFVVLFKKNVCFPHNLKYILLLLFQSYTAWNPIIYFVCSENFRNGLRRLLPCCAVNNAEYINELRMLQRPQTKNLLSSTMPSNVR